MMSASRWADHGRGIDTPEAPQEPLDGILGDCLWEGKTSKGLALSKARTYNKRADKLITEIVQTNDGTIEYYDNTGSIVESVTPPSGTHTDDSLPGSLRV